MNHTPTMLADAASDESVRSASPDPPKGAASARLLIVEVALSVVAFAALCAFVLSVAPQIAEPDDGAYHHSIVAMTMGDLLSLSRAQLDAVETTVHGRSGVPNQWIELPDGRYISEKNPGYPFLAAPLEATGIIRWTPLFYGALACLGLFIGARRWLGRFGGTAAVGLYCSSGAAIAFAWRDYMPTFTEASLIAAGSGLLLWAVLATETTVARRTWAGLAGFVALELATFVRYTDLVILACAVVVAIVAQRVRAASLPRRTLGVWLASVAVFGVGVALFDDLVYGGPLTTGYAPSEITFDLGAVVPNLQAMPAHLLKAMPMLVLALVTLAWIVARWLRLRRVRGSRGTVAGRDLAVGLALGVSWFAIWGLYAAYTWTVDPTSVTVQVVRFYVPALGAIALLGAWLVTRIPGGPWVTGTAVAVSIAVLFGLGVSAFYSMYEAFGVTLTG